MQRNCLGEGMYVTTSIHVRGRDCSSATISIGVQLERKRRTVYAVQISERQESRGCQATSTGRCRRCTISSSHHARHDGLWMSHKPSLHRTLSEQSPSKRQRLGAMTLKSYEESTGGIRAQNVGLQRVSARITPKPANAPAVRAMKNWNTLRSGYQSPMLPNV